MRDFSSIIKDKGIPWVRHWIQASHEWSKNFIDDNGVVDYEALGREEFEFREALYNKDFSRNKRAEYLWTEALKTHERQLANGKKGGRPKKSPQDAPHGNAGDESPDAGNGAAAKTPTSCDQLTADGDIHDGYIHLVGKGDKMAKVPVSTRLRAELERYGKPLPHIRSLSSSVKVAARNSGIEFQGEATNHRFRHSFASNLIRAGADIKSVQLLMRHENVEITLNTYSHLLGADLEKAVDRIG